VGAVSLVLLVQVPLTVSARLLGVAAVGGLTLATNISRFTTRVDDVVTLTLYPAVCAVKDRADLLFESFWKSNRLALLWATPLGAAAALFAGDFVHYIIGPKWRFAVPLIALFGINALLNQVGFNWTAFFRARGETRPVGVANAFGLVTALGIAIPLLVTDGLTGLGIGLCIATGLTVALRLWYLRRLFGDLPILGHISRGIGPTIPAVVTVLVLRAVRSGSDDPVWVAVEAIAYAAIAIAATYLSQGELLRESFSYLRGRAPAIAA
jgi:O-antigen/teichoic acid export membrane protein